MARKPTYKEFEQRIRELEKKTSKRKRAREALGEFREFKEKIISESPIGMSMYDSSGQCVAANDSVGELIGATKEQVLEQNYNDIGSWKTSGMLDKAKSAIRENSKKRYELIVKSTFGKDVSLDCHLVPFSSEGKTHLLLMINDISERLRAEEALKIITNEQAVLLASVPAMIFWIDKEGNFIRVNESFAAALRKSPDEISGKSLFDLYPEDQARKYHDDNLEVIESGNPKKNIDEPVQTHAGTMWISTDKIPYRDTEGNIVGIIGFSVDITERKWAEERAEEQLTFLQTLIDTLPTPIFYKDRDGKYTGCNKAFEEFVGRPRENIIGKTVYDMGPKRIADKYYEKDQELFQNPGKQVYEWKVNRKTGELREVIFNKATFTDADGKVAGLIGGISDITERKRAEEALQKAHDELERRVEERTAELLKANEQLEIEIEERERTEEKYKTLVESSLTGIFIHQDGKYVFVNDRFAEIHGFTPGELLGKEFLTLIHPDEREVLAHVASRRLMGEAMPQRYEVRRLGKDGRTIWCEMMANRIEYGGRPAIMGYIIDISERKQALAAVQQRDETLSGIISSVTDHMTMLDDKYNIVWANEVAKSLFGPDLVGKKCYSFYHGREKICEPCMVKKCFEDGKVFQFEKDITVPDGSQRTFWCTASVAGWHRDGRPNLVVEIFRDITERKHAEEALLKRKEELKALAHELEEMNTALKVLLKQRQEDKAEFEEKVLSNVEELVLPYVEILKKSRLDAEQMSYVSILESNLTGIVSPFLRKLSLKYLRLTPKEIQIADLIKLGKTSKQIAGLLNISIRAVEFHRGNIRTKLGLKNKKANLSSFLFSLE